MVLVARLILRPTLTPTLVWGPRVTLAVLLNFVATLPHIQETEPLVFDLPGLKRKYDSRDLLQNLWVLSFQGNDIVDNVLQTHVAVSAQNDLLKILICQAQNFRGKVNFLRKFVHHVRRKLLLAQF
jgi:hypothetical protein